MHWTLTWWLPKEPFFFLLTEPSRDSRHHLMLAATASSWGEVASRSAAVSVLLDVKFPFFTQKLKVSYTILPQWLQNILKGLKDTKLHIFANLIEWDFHPLMTGISENVPATSDDSPKTPEDNRRCPKMLRWVTNTSKAIWSFFDGFRTYWRRLKAFVIVMNSKGSLF